MNVIKNESDIKSILVIVDMVNGFVKEGNMADLSINECTPNIISLIKTYISNNDYILAFNDSHEINCKEFDFYPIHCLKNSNESLLIDEIKAFEKDIKVIEKNCTNGFMSEEFLPYFNKLKDVKEMVVVGCCSDICVLQFCLSMVGYINENNLDIQLICYKDCMDTFDNDKHNKKQYNEMACLLMANAGIIIKDSCEVNL